MKFWSNFIGDSNDENNFPRKFLLTNTQVSKRCKAFANGLSANLKLWKTKLYKIGQPGGFLGRLLGLLLKNKLPFIGNVLKPSAIKSLVISLGLTSPAAATDTAIDKTVFGSGRPFDLALLVTTFRMKKWMILWKWLSHLKNLVC